MRCRWMVLGMIWLLSAQLANAQFISSFGVKGGVALSNQSYRITPINYTMDTKPIFSPSVVFFAEAFQGDHFTMQTDFAFACRGSSTTTRSLTVDHLKNNQVIVNEGEKATSRHRYLAISPMLRARTSNGGVEAYALFGPRLDILLYYSSQSEYPLDAQNHVILGLTFGLGVEFPLKKNMLFTELLFQPDLSPVNNTEPLMINNNSLVLTLGYRWNRRK
ncbi:MAG: outer membrane beta-barrel protein [Bacteroides sp.]|nr:outer membrane beta-barrel protein [Bacteroides sp.]